MKGNNVFLSLISPLLQGFGLGAGLIVAIGAQNAFVLRQGLKRQHVFVVASLSTLSDAMLIFLGQAGLGALITASPIVAQVVTWCGIAFLLVYGFRSFKAAVTSEAFEAEASAAPFHLRETVTTILAVSLLNPHAFLDTVVLLGSVGAHYPLASRLSFALGAVLASLLWFFSLAYGAAWLAPLFYQPRTWRVLDIGVGSVMWGIAFSLLWKVIP
jgi:L-lysine exporter family protein LysE/ArgO